MIEWNGDGIRAVFKGDCRKLILELPDESIDVLVTSPPYWGQRISFGNGVENDPREYLSELVSIFESVLPKMKPTGLVWVNVGDAYNTPINWRDSDYTYSSLGPDKAGLDPSNSAYVKPRHKRRAFLEEGTPWLQYGNMLALPYRMVTGMCDVGYLFRGEVIWRKKNPMPEGRCRRPHRQHEGIYLFARDERHQFRVSPPVGSVWEFPNEKIDGPAHYSRFPEELPRRCIDAYGLSGPDVIVLDPFSGSGTTGVAAAKLGCSYIGFEIDPVQVEASNARIAGITEQGSFMFGTTSGVVDQGEVVVLARSAVIEQRPKAADELGHHHGELGDIGLVTRIRVGDERDGPVEDNEAEARDRQARLESRDGMGNLVARDGNGQPKASEACGLTRTNETRNWLNEVADVLHMSGECLCGAFARPGEREEVAFWFPDDFAAIADLEDAVASRDDIAPRRKRWGWGSACPVKDEGRSGPLCSSCTLFSALPASPPPT
jgi:DNA modification methylase